MSDSKERNFCFVYKGEAIRTDILEALHLIRAEGTYSVEDGNQYVQMSLHRKFGRRAANIPNVIEEYNSKVEEQARIRPIKLTQQTPKVICFKTTGSSESNAILFKISSDSRLNPSYWKWDLKSDQKQSKASSAAAAPPKPAPKKRRKVDTNTPITTGLEGIARELNIDPATLDMQAAYTAISRNYLQTKGVQLSTAGQFNAEDRTFLKEQLSRFFHREMAYTAKPFEPPKGHGKLGPNSQPNKTIAALVAHNGGSRSDFEFINGTKAEALQQATPELKEPNPFVPAHPNETISACLRNMTSRWLRNPDLKTAEVTTADFMRELNGGHSCGAYKSTCVPGFLRPFIVDGLVAIKDETQRPHSYIVRIQETAARLQQHSSA